MIIYVEIGSVGLLGFFWEIVKSHIHKCCNVIVAIEDERVEEVDEVEAVEERVGVSARREGVTERGEKEGLTAKVVWEGSEELPVRRGLGSLSPDWEEEAAELRASDPSSKSELEGESDAEAEEDSTSIEGSEWLTLVEDMRYSLLVISSLVSIYFKLLMSILPKPPKLNNVSKIKKRYQNDTVS